jgi:hypothetical protein
MNKTLPDVNVAEGAVKIVTYEEGAIDVRSRTFIAANGTFSLAHWRLTAY